VSYGDRHGHSGSARRGLFASQLTFPVAVKNHVRHGLRLLQGEREREVMSLSSPVLGRGWWRADKVWRGLVRRGDVGCSGRTSALRVRERARVVSLRTASPWVGLCTSMGGVIVGVLKTWQGGVR